MVKPCVYMISFTLNKIACLVTPNYCTWCQASHPWDSWPWCWALVCCCGTCTFSSILAILSKAMWETWNIIPQKPFIYCEMQRVLIEGVDRRRSQTCCGSSINPRKQCLCLAGKKAPWRRWQETGAIVEFPRCIAARSICAYEVSKIHCSGWIIAILAPPSKGTSFWLLKYYAIQYDI